MWLSRRPDAAAALLAADEVRELHRVADEEDRGVVADQVVVALGRVELQREAARVAPGVGAALLAGDGGEAGEHLGLDAGLEQRGLGVRRDVLGGLEHAERARALGVHVALGDALAVEVRHLVEEVVVVQQDRAVRAEGQRVAVARRRGAGVGRRAAVGWRLSVMALLLVLLGQGRVRRSAAVVAVERVSQTPERHLGLVDDEAGRRRPASRQGASPTAQSTSPTAPQPRQTRWWWLSPTRSS